MSTITGTYSREKIRVQINSQKSISAELVEEIAKALKSVGGYGSIEIYVQDHNVTQITVRNIKKTKHFLAE